MYLAILYGTLMYQRLKSLGASDITNSSDEIVKTAKAKYGYNIYMVRF